MRGRAGRRCWSAVVGAVATGALVLAGQAVHPGAAAAAAVPVLRLGFDGTDTFASGTAVRDDSGVVRGRVVTNRGALSATTGNPGGAVRYPCATCGRAMIEVPDSASLDPGSAAFAVGVDVRMTREESRRTMNVVQKGYYSQAGGQYKVQVDYGQPGCVVNGSRTRIVLVASTAAANVADGAWHRIVCSRTSTEVLLLVDGVVRARRTGVVGTVSNSAPLRIGAKDVTSSDNDQFRASLDNVTIEVG